MKKGHKYYLDLDVLRILASIAVVLVHVASQKWYTVTDLKTFTVFNFFDCIGRFAVPIFFMISGVLFLDKNRQFDFKTFFRKHLLKMVITYVVWCILYYLFDYLFLGKINKITIKGLITSVIENKFVLWFLKVMIYIYLFLPFIRTIVEHSNEKQIKYFLAIFFVIGVLFYQTTTLPLPLIIKNMFVKMRIHDRIWYLGYFVLGWYIYNKEISITKRKWLYILGLLSVNFCFLFTNVYFMKTGIKNSCLYEYFSINTFIYSLSVFVFVKYWIKRQNLVGINLQNFSKYTLGIYLIHVFVLEYICKMGLDTLSFNPVLATVLITVIVYTISYLITFVIRKIPLLKEVV